MKFKIFKKLKDLLCPHCGEKLDRVEWRAYADGKVAVVGCAKCLKAIGTNVLPQGQTL